MPMVICSATFCCFDQHELARSNSVVRTFKWFWPKVESTPDTIFASTFLRAFSCKSILYVFRTPPQAECPGVGMQACSSTQQCWQALQAAHGRRERSITTPARAPRAISRKQWCTLEWCFRVQRGLGRGMGLHGLSAATDLAIDAPAPQVYRALAKPNARVEDWHTLSEKRVRRCLASGWWGGGHSVVTVTPRVCNHRAPAHSAFPGSPSSSSLAAQAPTRDTGQHGRVPVLYASLRRPCSVAAAAVVPDAPSTQAPFRGCFQAVSPSCSSRVTVCATGDLSAAAKSAYAAGVRSAIGQAPRAFART